MFDFAVIGGGIVGLSTARALLERHPGARLVVLEKERGWARHQTGHNSGVIHSGIYYEPGSLKARFCREGARALVEFCQERGIDHEICGKVIAAVEPDELPLLDDLYEQGLKNSIEVEKIGPEELREIEPHASGLAALKVPSTGIVDFAKVAEAFAAIVKENGGQLRTGTEVKSISEPGGAVVMRADRGAFRARRLVNCAGLHSDRVARLCGVEPGTKIVPFRGEHYELRPERRYLVKNLIYPVPNPGFPFLGVHFTRSIDGIVEAGPNAVLGFAREGYKKTDFDFRDFIEQLTYPALWRLARKTGARGSGRSIAPSARRRS
jgi:(S)-2-hydroxyglutarate dehydrogenase